MRRLLASALVLTLTACGGTDQPSSPESPDGAASASSQPGDAAPSGTTAGAPSSSARAADDVVQEFSTKEHGEFNEGWAMEFLPGTDYLLISERVGKLQLRDQTTGEAREVGGMPEVHHKGQAGMHDVIAAPSFETDQKIYLSWVEMSEAGPRGVVGLGRLDLDKAELMELDVIWRQDAQEGDGHFSLRMLVHDDHLFVTSGDRQKFHPAQDHGTNLGKIVRLSLDGLPAQDNPLGNEGVESQFWTLGHRNALGIDVDTNGQIWVSEMGPKGGDELNLIKPGANYGWPEVSNGIHYDGADIPDHSDGDGFEAPKAYWTPSISPGNLEIVEGDLFTGWTNSALLGGLSGQRIVRVQLDGEKAEVAQEWDMGARIRAIEEAPDGAIWVLEDKAGGRLLELRPK